jgi:hypothetical protein
MSQLDLFGDPPVTTEEGLSNREINKLKKKGVALPKRHWMARHGHAIELLKTSCPTCGAMPGQRCRPDMSYVTPFEACSQGYVPQGHGTHLFFHDERELDPRKHPICEVCRRELAAYCHQFPCPGCRETICSWSAELEGVCWECEQAALVWLHCEEKRPGERPTLSYGGWKHGPFWRPDMIKSKFHSDLMIIWPRPGVDDE